MWYEIDFQGSRMRVQVVGLSVLPPQDEDDSPAWASSFVAQVWNPDHGQWSAYNDHQPFYNEDISQEISESGHLKDVLVQWLAREAEAQRGL